MTFYHSVLTALMEQRKLTITEVSKLTGLAPSQVHGIINRKVKSPSTKVVTKLSQGLGVDWRIFYEPGVLKKERKGRQTA